MPITTHGAKIAASRLNMPLGDYLGHLAAGRRRCCYCKTWKPEAAMIVHQKGRAARCKACIRDRQRERRVRNNAS